MMSLVGAAPRQTVVKRGYVLCWRVGGWGKLDVAGLSIL